MDIAGGPAPAHPKAPHPAATTPARAPVPAAPHAPAPAHTASRAGGMLQVPPKRGGRAAAEDLGGFDLCHFVYCEGSSGGRCRAPAQRVPRAPSPPPFAARAHADACTVLLPQVTCETTAGHDNQGTMPVTVTVNGSQSSTLWAEVYSASRTPSEGAGGAGAGLGDGWPCARGRALVPEYCSAAAALLPPTPPGHAAGPR